MTVKQFKVALDALKMSLSSAIDRNVDLTKRVDDVRAMYSFKDRKAQHLMSNAFVQLNDVIKYGSRLSQLIDHNASNGDVVNKMRVNVRFLEEYWSQPIKAIPIIEELERQTKSLDLPKDSPGHVKFRVPPLPSDIRDEVTTDIAELKKCFDSGCYRSSVILCGRVLEAALHRKYYDITGHDILEKNPGIGLGTLIAKLKEKEVRFDPGLTQQIHLINQARIFSVHKKQEPFVPSKDQAHAIILYTLDILWKMF